jgi:hypothetical protein
LCPVSCISVFSLSKDPPNWPAATIVHVKVAPGCFLAISACFYLRKKIGSQLFGSALGHPRSSLSVPSCPTSPQVRFQLGY